jgi:putative metallohydrolase (TIGR04338 family)
MSRDTGRADVYAAEEIMQKMIDRANQHGLTTLTIAGSTIAVPMERKFGDLGSVQTYVDQVMARVREDYPRVPKKVTVRARKGDGKAHYERLGSVIAIPPHQSWARSWAMRELVVLHEIAHHLSRDAAQSHGPQFLAAYLDLLERFVGPEAALMLRVVAHEGGVKVG